MNSAGFTVVADTTGPSGTINAPSGPVAPGEVFSASIVFDEPIIGFDSSDISVGNGTLSNFVAITDESGAADSFTFDVTAGTVGTVTIDVAAAAGQDAAGNDSSVLTQATTTVAGELQISATFLGDAPAPGDTTTLRLTIENTDASEVGTISSFTSNLQENLTGLAAALPASTNTCGSSPSGTTFLIVTGGTVAASSSCIIEIPVTVPGGAAPDTYPVRTSNLSFSYPVAGAGVSDAAVTQLTVAGAEGAGAPLAFSKSFTDDPVLPGGTVTLEYTIVPEEGTDASSLAFSDDLDAALSGLVATGLPQSDVCGTGSTLSGTSTISLSGGNIADGATCTFSVTLQTPTGTSGDFVSSTSELTGNQDGGSGAVAIDTGAIASDTLTLINQVPQVVQSGPAGPVAVGEGFTLTVEFSEPVTGFVAGDLIVTNGSASNLQTSDNETFTVTITPAAAGTVTVELPAGVAQDTDTNGNVAATDYTVEAETAAPEIEVQFVGSSLALTDGSATASTATGTDFGVVDVTTGSLTRTLRITNSGVGALSVTSIALTDTTNFGLTAALPTSVAGGGGTLDVPVTFDPTSVATFPATITINSDDADEAAFDFAISGEGGAAPEINVTGNSVNIADGDTSVTAADHTQFETIDVSATGTRTFTIENQGGSVLTLGANAVSITDDASGVFSVSAQPATTVAASGSETFTIQFTPSDVGTFTGLVNIASDDASENPYTFAIEATATGEPEVDLQGNGVSIVSGDVTPAAADDTSFEGVAVGSNASATFTIRNTGNDELVLTPPGGGRGDPVVRGAGSTDFTVTDQPGLSIAAGGSETFSIQYAPSTAGVASATFQFGTNDDDEATYSFTVGGEGTEKEIAVGQGATDFTSGVSSFEFVDNTGSAFNGGTVGLDAGTETVTFTISNVGSTTLNLGANAVSLSGAGSGDFSVTSQPATTVAPAGSTNFEITFDPSAVGDRQATVSVANDDSDESPFTFDINGFGVDLTPPAAFSKGFAPATVSIGGTSTLTFTIDNSGGLASASGLGFTDNMPSGMTVAAVPNASTTCTGGTLTAAAGTGTITYTGGTVSGAATCTVSVDVTGGSVGSLVNTTGDLTSNQGNSGTASDTLTVTQPSVTIADVTVSEGDGTADFTVSLSAAPSSTTTVDFATADGTAIAGSDYTAIGGTVTFLAGQTSQTVSVVITDDTSDEPTPETFTVTLSSPTNADLGSPSTATGSINDNDDAPEISIADASISENGGTVDFAVSLSNPSASSITVDFATADGTAIAGSDYVATSGTLTFNPGDTADTITVTITDDGVVEPSETFTVDLSGATNSTIVDGSATGTITNDDAAPVGYTASFDADPVNNAGASATSFTLASAVVGTTYDFTISSDGGGTAVTGSGSVTSAGQQVSGIDVSGLGDGTLTLSVTLTDTFGNEGVAATDTAQKETGLPAVAITTTSADPVSGVFSVTVTFSEAVTGFAVGDLTVGNGAASNFAGSGDTYTADVTPSSDGTVTVDVAAGVAQDAAGNTNTAATQFSIESDGTAPGLVISTASADPVSGTFAVTFTFDEAVTGFAVGDITVGNGAAGNFAGSGDTYTADITPGADGTVTVDVAAGVAQDAAGNTNTAATQFSIENDGTAPGVVIQSVASSPVSGPFRVTITFDEPVSGFVSGDVTIGNGSVLNFNDAGIGLFQVDILPSADGTVTVDVAAGVAQDAAGNSNTAATQFSILSDGTAPGVVISTTSADPVSGAFTVTFTFDEDVTGFATGDITVGNGAVTRFATTSASIYSAEITPTSDGTVTVDVAAGVAEDAAGNLNTAATQFSIESDATRPGVEITTASADPVSGVFEVTFTFTEDVTGFVVGDITVGNGSAGNFQSTSASVYTADITPAADGAVTVDVAGGAAADAAGNTNTAATQFSIESDGSAPTVVSVVVSDADLRVGDVGTPFTVEVTFSEALDPAGGVLSFDEDLNPTLTLAELAMSGGNTVLTFTFDVADTGLFRPGVDVLVSEFADPAGNVMALSTTSDVFSIDLRRAGITVTQDVLGLVDAEFDYSGDLGVFTVTTSGQTGSEVFTDLVEGSYAITLAEEAGFSITDIACTGGATAIDLPNRTATVTLAPADAVQCNFEATADPGIDEINVPDVALTLPNVVGDPTGVTTSFALTNTGGAPFAFNASTDQPWLAIDPTSGSIPAASDLTFTLSFTDAVLALAPGEYTANIIITEAAPAGPTSAGASTTQSVQNITIPVSITITPREGTLTLVATTASSIAGEGVFTYSSDIGALDGLSLSTINGTASSDGVTVLSGTYAITQAVSEGWRLDSISCTGDTDNGSTFDVDTGTATIDLDPEETMVCTFANRRDEAFIREVTQSAIRSFMAARADQILNASPDVGRRLRTDRATATPNSFAFDMTEGRLNASMSMSLSAIRQAASERENRMPDQEAFSLAGETGMASVDVWVEASYASVSDDRAGLTADTDFGMYALGVDMMVSDDMLIGVLAQFDQAETITGEFRSQVEGDGWLAGPYMAARLSERMVFDARVAWGQSDNQVNPIGTYWDDFETSRWLAEANLVGDIINGAWRFSPGVGIAYFSEEQKQYTDSLGFVIPSQEITLGRITAGPEIAYRFETPDGGVFEPFVKVTAVYDYDDTEVINLSGQLAGLGNFRADARVGLAAEFANGGRLSAEAMFSGVGEGDFEATTGMIRVRLPLSLQ